MTHITFGLFRKGVREPGTTLSGMAGAPSFPTPFSMASAAITRHHRESPQAAERTLRRSLASSSYWGEGGPASAQGWADAVRRCYRTYAQMTANDNRPVFASGLNRELDMPPDDLSVRIDVVLLDRRGYVGRIVLWDTFDMTSDRAELYAAPVWRVLEDELGDGRVAGVEVWHLRTRGQIFVDAITAAARLLDAERRVHSIAT
jgi:hypothetical protein